MLPRHWRFAAGEEVTQRADVRQDTLGALPASRAAQRSLHLGRASVSPRCPGRMPRSGPGD